MTTYNCKTCKYSHYVPPITYTSEYSSHTTTSQEYRQCRYNPPVVMDLRAHGVESTFPVVADDDWCGKYAQI